MTTREAIATKNSHRNKRTRRIEYSMPFLLGQLAISISVSLVKHFLDLNKKDTSFVCSDSLKMKMRYKDDMRAIFKEGKH